MEHLCVKRVGEGQFRVASMRVLCVVAYYKPAYVYGGPARSVPALCEAMAQQNAQVTVFTTNANGKNRLDLPTGVPLKVDGVEVYYFPLSSLSPPRYYYSQSLTEACYRQVKFFDVVYICGNWVSQVPVASRSALKAGVPYVISPRGSFMEWPINVKWSLRMEWSINQKRLKKKFYLWLVERHCMDHAAAIHCTSDLEAEQIVDYGFRPPVVVIPNPAPRLLPGRPLVRGHLRQQLGIPLDAPVSLFVGRLHQLKRLSRTIEIYAQVKKDIPDLHFVIVGDDEDGSGLLARQQVSSLGLQDSVHFTGLLKGDDLIQAYLDADLLVFFSYRENFGMVVVEALSMGVPVLLSKEVGIGAEVVEYNAGLVVDVDSDEAGEKWKSLILSSQLRQHMSAAGYCLTQAIYSPENVSKKMLELFSQLVASKVAG